jgi:hypothetical protein
LASSSAKHWSIASKRLSLEQTVTQWKKHAQSILPFDAAMPLSFNRTESPALIESDVRSITKLAAGKSSSGWVPDRTGRDYSGWAYR